MVIVCYLIILIWKYYATPAMESFVADYHSNEDVFIPNYIKDDLNGSSSHLASVKLQTLLAPDAKLCRNYAARTCRDVRAYDRYSWCYPGQLDHCLKARKEALLV